ncbi:MAG: arsenate reductase [Flavobacteriales bacterium]|jgi:arsenate reductase
MKIYHNPRCSKSRETLALLRENGVEPEIVEYLKDPITVAEMKRIIDMLGIKPFDLVRKGEPVFKKEYKTLNLSDDEWIDVMLANPKLIERPIVVKNNSAVLGRPPEDVLKLV